jgi:hypothetical protein
MVGQLSTTDIVSGTLIFTAALSWNMAIRDTIDSVFPFHRVGVLGNILFATIVTLLIIAVFVIYNWIHRYLYDSGNVKLTAAPDTAIGDTYRETNSHSVKEPFTARRRVNEMRPRVNEMHPRVNTI